VHSALWWFNVCDPPGLRSSGSAAHRPARSLPPDINKSRVDLVAVSPRCGDADLGISRVPETNTISGLKGWSTRAESRLMNVWLLKTSEPVPLPGAKGVRVMRTGSMAQMLVAQGHQVLWWNGTFNHRTRQQQYEKDTHIDIQPGWSVWFLKGQAYRRNLSIARMLNHRQIARQFCIHADEALRPDVIVCSFPTIEFADAATAFGGKRGIPVVLDLRDMWPDIFPAHFPHLVRPLVRMALIPLYRQSRRALERATALIGITDEFLDWGVDRARRKRDDFDRVVPLACSDKAPEQEDLTQAELFWDKLGVRQDRQIFTVTFTGSLGLQHDLDTIIEASRRLSVSGVNHQLVICGTGQREHAYRERARHLANVIMPGWISRPQLYVLLRRSHIGLDPLPRRFDFLATINNKAIEYLSSGLPIISCPRDGALFRLLQRESCGASYMAADVDGLLGLLRALILDRERVAAMGASALRVYQASFNSERVYGNFVTYLERLAERARQIARV